VGVGQIASATLENKAFMADFSSSLYSPTDSALAKIPNDISAAINQIIVGKEYPCVPAMRSILSGSYLVGVYRDFGTGRQADRLYQDLMYFREKQKSMQSLYYSFWAIFDDRECSFPDFETRLWNELSQLASRPENSAAWDKNFSDDPQQENFCISLGGEAFFVVGMHPDSPRLARRFPFPTLIFNLYDQFEELSRRGQYEAIVKTNRERELSYQGSLNPMVEKYGDKWESIQFSGKENLPEWKCPFHRTEWKHIAPQTGTAFELKTGQSLTVTDPTGRQVADLFCFGANDKMERLSAGRSIDYADSIYLTTGQFLYSNRSRPMLKITKDTCGHHDLLMTPCSLKMFQLEDDNEIYHPSCDENLAKAFAAYDIRADEIGTTFNIFMIVNVDEKGGLKINPPLSKAGDQITLEAQMDLIVGLTACAHEPTNGGRCKSISYSIG